MLFYLQTGFSRNSKLTDTVTLTISLLVETERDFPRGGGGAGAEKNYLWKGGEVKKVWETLLWILEARSRTDGAVRTRCPWRAAYTQTRKG